MRVEWRAVQLGDVCQLKYGKSLPKAKRSGSGYSVFGSNGQVGLHHEALTEGTTIIVGRKGSFGEVAFSKDRCWPIDTTYYVDESATSADLRWLFYRMRAMPLTQLNRAAAVPGLSRDDAYAQPLLLPPLDEQRRIAAVLDVADALRILRREALAKLDDLIQSAFVDMFGDPTVESAWPKVRLAEVCQSKGEYGANVPAVEFDSGKPRYLRITDIRSDGTLTDEAVGPGGTENQWRSKVLNPGDIVFARSGATVGKTFLMRDENVPLVFAGYLIKFVPDQRRVLPEFLYRCTRTEKYRSWVAGAATTVAQPNVNASKYAELELLLPPMALQRRFVSAVERVRPHRGVLEASSLAMDTLFASLQQRAFRGEL